METFWNYGGAWLLGLLAILAIEWVAIRRGWRTLSAQVWATRRHRVWRWLLPVLTLIGYGILFAHFWLGLWGG